MQVALDENQSPLAAQSARLTRWVTDRALPFWADTGIDAHGGWFEHLNLEGRPNTDVVRRLRVQARQIYVYALAEKRGWYPGQSVAERTFDFMMKHGFEKGGEPGFIHLLNPDYSVNNPRRDFYDHAFYLLACASLVGLSHDQTALQTAQTTFDFLDGSLKSPHGGWTEGIPAQIPRRQNPHMHFLEACMAWHDVSGAPAYLAYAAEVYALFEAHFFDGKHHIIREFFEDDWTVASGDLGETAEPGHAAEWIWLLKMYQDRAGIDTSKYAAKLYAKLLTKGDGFQNDEEDIAGEPRRETRRLWVQTELIKAHLAQAQRGDANAASRAAALIDRFMDIYLRPDGTWMDQIGACNQPLASTIPASTFYHIACMIAEAEDTVSAMKSKP